MAHLVIVYWRDIPAQVIAETGRGRKRQSAKVELPERFAVAIDRAAMRGGARDTEAYLAAWHRAAPVACSDDLAAEAAQLAARLDASYDSERLRALVATGGSEC